MSFSVRVQSPPFLPIPRSSIPQLKLALQFRAFSTTIPPLQASNSRISNLPQEGSNLVDDPRRWTRTFSSEYSHDDEEDDDDDDEDRSLDLLVKFVHNVFKKVSKRARKAVRSVLPLSISTKLVGFSVNGVLVLAFLWVLKAFLEVICTLGSVVFVSILLIRGIWSGVAYLQESRNLKANELDDEQPAWTNLQPVT
ncbi:Short hypocotyl in white light1 protein [Quillaja saponaria]|uniref:Short hypocotyl in white light1 protein n=1 Tax=Quillaja saponaria TaxID=32244 RepID=A0AAD7M0V6_QUISA|nr:Short hypocotyl in white light1 protein [Quillaja saponaria]